MAPILNLAASSTTENTTSKSTMVSDHFINEFTVIQSRYQDPGVDRFETEGKPIVRRTVQYFVDNSLPITIVLPAFPFKSPNAVSKVLGKLPDRGEELALQRLEDFCLAVERVYPLGCSVVIFSDGRVFNDLLGVPDEDLKAFKVELKAMVEDAGHTHIKFDGLENYTSNTEDPIREILERFHVEDMDMNQLIKEDAGLLNTYRSFRKFLLHDLAPQWVGMSKNAVGNRCGAIAKKMMHRNIGFSTLVDKTYPHAFRMSIHLYNNAGPKFGVHLIPHSTGVPRTPWHSVICEDLDGSIHTRARHEVDESVYELMEKRGRAWGFRERIKEADSSVADVPPTATSAELDHQEEWKALNVEFIEQPLCLIIQAKSTAPSELPSIMDIPVESYRSLIHKHGVVSLRGFKQDDDLEAASERMGEILEWPFGKVFEIKIVADTTLPGQTMESMPMHYDGMYKKKSEDATELGDVPLLQLFHCVEAYPSSDPADAHNGCTLFAHSRHILASLTADELERLRSITLVYKTTLLGNKTLTHTSPVIIQHPVTGEDVIRYHEPWGPEKTKLHPVTVRSLPFVNGEVAGDEDVDANWVRDFLLPKIYDPTFCYSHQWVKGEFIISDNISLVHSRTAMKADGRYVRRVHIN